MRTAEESRTGSFVRDRTTWAAYVLLAYFGYLESALGPLMPFLRADLRFSYGLAGLHFSAFAGGIILAGVLGERVVRRIGRRAAFWGGAAGMAAGSLAVAVGRTVLLTLGGVVVMGLFGTLLLLTLQAVLSEHHGARRAIALTEANIGASLGGSVAAVALGVGQQSGLGWRAALLLALVLPVAAACGFHALALEAPRPLVRRAAPQPAALPALFWVYWSIILLLGAAEWCVTYWGAEYLHRPVGFEGSVAAALMSAFLLAMVAGRVLGSRLVRVVASTPLLVVAIAGALGGFVLFWWAPVPLVAVGGLAVTGLGVANLYPLGLASAVAVAARESERASARITLSSGLALLLAPLTVGGLADRVGLRAAYSVVPVLLVVALVGTLLTLRRVRRQGHVA